MGLGKRYSYSLKSGTAKKYPLKASHAPFLPRQGKQLTEVIRTQSIQVFLSPAFMQRATAKSFLGDSDL